MRRRSIAPSCIGVDGWHLDTHCESNSKSSDCGSFLARNEGTHFLIWPPESGMRKVATFSCIRTIKSEKNVSLSDSYVHSDVPSKSVQPGRTDRSRIR